MVEKAIPKEWIEDYLRKSGDADVDFTGLEVEVNENGFMAYALLDDAVELYYVYGNGRYWDRRAEEIARRNGLRKIRFATSRNPFSFIRKYKYRLIGFILEKEVS